MAKAKKSSQKSQSARFLEAAKKAGVTEKSFEQAIGKLTLAKQGREPSKKR